MHSILGDGGLAFGGSSGNWYGSPGRGVEPAHGADDEARRGIDDWNQGFGSAHPGVVMAAFGDGSVRGIRLDIDDSMGGVLFRLGRRDDVLSLEIRLLIDLCAANEPRHLLADGRRPIADSLARVFICSAALNRGPCPTRGRVTATASSDP
jgi:hypothetical protein